MKSSSLPPALATGVADADASADAALDADALATDCPLRDAIRQYAMYRFLHILSVRLGSSFAISAHLLPSLCWLATSVVSSSSLHFGALTAPPACAPK